jgi:hypothetical protein
MRTLILLGWLLLPVGFGIWHYGPGQDRVRLDDVSKLLAKGDQLAADEEWAEAVSAYDEALKLLPPEKVSAARRIRLAKAKAQMQIEQLPVAHGDLRALCDELQTDPKADRKLLAEARSTLAQAHYYMTWVMRLEGLPREVWEPEIESARQTYRLLAEQAGERGDEVAERKNQEDLEAAVRLARMDLTELQGLPLPKQCCGCCSGKKPGRSMSKGKVGQQRPKDARGASSGPPPDTTGH